MATLRIVNLVTQMEAGGAQAMAFRLSSELRRRHHVAETWFLYRKRPSYDGREGVRVILPHPPRGPADYALIFARLLRDLRAFGPHAVITYTHYANVLGQAAARLLGIRSRLASQHNPAWSYPRAARWCDYALGSLGFYTANLMCSYSVGASFAGYPRPYRSRARVIHNGIAFRPSSLGPAEARQRFSLPDTAPLLVTTGRLAEQKNHTLLLRAIAPLSGVHLAIAGDGELRDELEATADALGVRGRLYLLGEIDTTDVPDFLRAGDVFVMPSRFEGLSVALIEAISAGLPVVASDIPPQAEVLRPEDGDPVGLLLPPDDADAWTSAIGRLLDDHEWRSELAARSLQRAAYFGLEHTVSKYEECILQDGP